MDGLPDGVNGVGCEVGWMGWVAWWGEMGWVAWWGGWVGLQQWVNGVLRGGLDCRMG